MIFLAKLETIFIVLLLFSRRVTLESDWAGRNRQGAEGLGVRKSQTHLGTCQSSETLNNNLLAAELHVYFFLKSVLKALRGFLKSRWHRTKVDTYFSSRKNYFKDFLKVLV